MLRALLSPEFVAFVAEGGYTVTEDGDAVEVWNTGGEVRFRVRAARRGQVVDTADRAEDYRPVFQGQRLDDAERYLTVTIGGSVRQARRLGAVGFDAGTPIAAGYRVEQVGERTIALISEAEPERTMEFLRGMEWETIKFSYVMRVTLDELRAALLDPDGRPVFDAVRRPVQSAPTAE